MNQAVIGVGSNIDPENNIAKARHLVSRHFNILKASSFVVTKPIGFSIQPDFQNGAWLIECREDLQRLTESLHEIEKQLKRVRTENKNGPRTIDLDVIVWNNKIIDKDVYTRDFLKESLLELCPELAEKISL